MSKRRRCQRMNDHAALGRDVAGRKLAVESLESRRLLAIDFDLLKDINATESSGSSFPTDIAEVGSTAFFVATTPLHGLEAFFRDPQHSPPPRWKMAIVTWLGVFPSVLFWSSTLPKVLPGLPSLGVMAIINVFVVVTLAWGVMPLLTKLFAGWLRQNT